VHTIESLTRDLRGLGIVPGDILMMGADLGNVGLVEGNIRKTLLSSLRAAVGDEGTLVTVAFSQSFFLSQVDPDYVFDRNAPSDSGGLTRLFLGHPDAVRSSHPTNSFVAIGRDAQALMRDHDEHSTSYRPIGEIIKRGGKMFLIGCVDERNGLQAVHYAQEYLGLTRRNILCGHRGVYYRRGDEVKLFVHRDIGGCSRGFHKFYTPLVVHGGLRAGYYGDAYSVIIDARTAFEIVRDILARNPRAFTCDDPNCFFCRGSWWFNKRDMPGYYVRNFLRLLPKILRLRKR
jgi:aminoglycoside 3-N-acetyltransferase